MCLSDGRRCRHAIGASRFPERLGGPDGIDPNLGPPPCLVAGAVELAVVSPAERDGEFIAHLAAKRPGLGEAQVVRIAGSSPTK